MSEQNLEAILNVINSLPSMLQQTDDECANKNPDDSASPSQLKEDTRSSSSLSSCSRLSSNESRDNNNNNKLCSNNNNSDLSDEFNNFSSNEISHSSVYAELDANLDLGKNENLKQQQQTRIPMGLFKKNTVQNKTTINSSLETRIPRFGTKIPKPMTPSSLSSNSASSLNASSVNNPSFFSTPNSIINNESKNLIETTNLVLESKSADAKPRVSRSISRWVGVNSGNKINNAYQENDLQNSCSSNKTSLMVNGGGGGGGGKRGVSMTATSSSTKSTRSISINDDLSENMSENRFNPDAQKTVRYIIRHKPKESQVKIFSQKVELKNVSSKIGSLENYNYKPGGGALVIENRKLNWSAQSKINSLEKAGNYKPGGGNVKIENHKLNFKERARPKTDTGLIIIETMPTSYCSSQYVSSENLSSMQEFHQEIIS